MRVSYCLAVLHGGARISGGCGGYVAAWTERFEILTRDFALLAPNRLPKR